MEFYNTEEKLSNDLHERISLRILKYKGTKKVCIKSRGKRWTYFVANSLITDAHIALFGSESIEVVPGKNIAKLSIIDNTLLSEKVKVLIDKPFAYSYNEDGSVNQELIWSDLEGSMVGVVTDDDDNIVSYTLNTNTLDWTDFLILYNDPRTELPINA